jgi:hypothetical protein
MHPEAQARRSATGVRRLLELKSANFYQCEFGRNKERIGRK